MSNLNILIRNELILNKILEVGEGVTYANDGYCH
jgi:hypothetical protein